MVQGRYYSKSALTFELDKQMTSHTMHIIIINELHINKCAHYLRARYCIARLCLKVCAILKYILRVLIVRREQEVNRHIQGSFDLVLFLPLSSSAAGRLEQSRPLELKVQHPLFIFPQSVRISTV